MTIIHLTDKDYEVINSGDIDEIKRHVNDLRGELIAANQELHDIKTSVRSAIRTADTPTERICKLRASLRAGEYEPTD